MRAVICAGPGGPGVLRVADVAAPRPGPEQLRVRVRAAALNRGDTLQRMGEYPAPPGQSEILGVEIAGEVESCGPGVDGFSAGDRVFGLVDGGGYAELCLLDHRMAIRMPDGLSFTDAAAVPEVFFTADTMAFALGELAPGEAVLVHAGGSGVGTACIQMARSIGARVFCTVGSEEKARRAVALGAHAAVNHRTHDFAQEIARLTGGAGVDVVLDFLGASYLARNLAVLRTAGRLVLAGVMGGTVTSIDLDEVIVRRLQIKGTVMRARPLADKRAITQRFRERWLPLLADGRVHPVVDSVYPLEEAARAHEAMEANRNFGKIVLALEGAGA